jgi:hypothetical protein
MPSVLFLIVTLTWGLTWYAIHLQLGLTPDAVSIFLRFAVAAGCMWLGLIATRRARRDGATTCLVRGHGADPVFREFFTPLRR